MNLEIGGGTLAGPGWINLDPAHGSGPEWTRYAQDTPWPAADNSVDAIRASHVMEHIPAGADRLAVMNEAHRVLRSGGTLEIIVPVVMTDGTPQSWKPYADPTHVSFWCWESFHYFDGSFPANADYGLKYWTTVTQEWHAPAEVRWVGVPR